MSKKHVEALSPVNKVVPIHLIKPHSDNYNQHPEEQIKQLGMSYSELGQFRSVVLWEQSDGTYIQLAGHGVVEAMKREDATEVRADVHPSSLDPMIAKRILLADNLHAKNSISDDEALVRLLQEQQDAGYDLASLGSDDETLRQMLESLGDGYLGGDGNQEKPDVQFKEYDESIADDLDTELCQQCGKLCLKSGKGRK